MSRELAVFLHGHRIGTVEQSTQGRLSFDYIDEPPQTPLSLSMPPAAGARYPEKRVKPWISGLLPDSEDVRERWGREFHVNGSNPFALLEKMGLDCAGAVQFAPGDERPSRTSSLTPITTDEIGRRLTDLRVDEAAWTVPGERWSLAGAQSKFALAQDRDGNWFEPRGDAPSTHIVKPGVASYRDQALNEHVCLQAARALGMSAVRTSFEHFAGQPALVVTRYDRRRVRGGDAVTRVHQEDMCQALSVYPRKKYESSGGPGAARIARLLRETALNPAEEVQRFAEAVAFNYLVGAPDAHAKNYSVLLTPTSVVLAPLYDVASAFPYEPTRHDSELHLAAMSVGGQREFGSVLGEHWDRFAAGCGIDRDSMRETVARLAKALPGALEDSLTPYVTSYAALRTRLLSAVTQHADRTLAGLAQRSSPNEWRSSPWKPELDSLL